MKNTIIQWRGGGYSGNFWEPNTGFFNNEGAWIYVISTGCDKRNSIEEFNRKKATEDLVFPITREGILEFQKEIRDDFFVRTLQTLDDHDYDVYWKCDICGKVLTCLEDLAGFESSRGCGGIEIIQEGLICSSCYSINTCPRCNKYNSQEDQTKFDICVYCLDELKEKNEHLYSLIEIELPGFDAQLEELTKLKPHRKESYEKMHTQAVRELKERIQDIIDEG